MSLSFPHPYTATVTRIGPSRASVEAPPRAPLIGTPPPELHGDAEAWSPEHLLCSALGLCVFATFEAFAARDKLAVVDYRDTVTGMLDKTAGGLAFTSFTVAVEITVAAADAERARALMDRAKKHCIISKALQVPVTIETQIWEAAVRAHA